MKKALFYAAGSDHLGYGHLYRVLSIINDLKKNLFFSVLVKNETQENFWAQHGIPFVKKLPRKFDIIVIDSKEDLLPFCIDSILYDTRATFLAIDTLCGWSSKADFVISPTFYSDKMPKFKRQKNFLGGRDFVSIRPGSDTPLQVRDILVTFGGSDPNNITELILKSLTELELQKHTNVILGPSYNASRFLMETRFPKVNFYSSVDATIEFVRSANIVVTALGTTVNEIEFTKKFGFLIFNYEEDELDFGHLRSSSMQKEKWFNFGIHQKFKKQKFELAMRKYLNRRSHEQIEKIPNLNRISEFINLKF